MLAGSPGLSSMMQTRRQKHFLYDASWLPRLVFNDANQAPTNMFHDASPQRFFNDANLAPKTFFCTMLAGSPGLSSMKQTKH